ncbi:alpha/beta fold hydrolase [Pseudotabrizicola alkalilacus]|uniref:Alpha/beta hydrolase n=1 Tax=Pseudotabrizicola alkalilacus TaxID=2305252 RepID=A0A411Z3Q5_9RHOB|nr:alpha/beta hydrolase [Pseudotabrizicola alkalilacus]RGP37675.1 alpha/beta hydrolase [Pseudotabrizicola alkalilacus]
MTHKILAASAALIGFGLIAATNGRLSAREQAAVQSHPPTGQFVTVEGVQVHLQVAGAGPDLVLIHGANGNLREFTFALMDQLTDRYRVIAVDRPGLGYSDPLPDNGASVQDQARLLRQAVAQIGVQNPIVLGQSYGGAVALAWALQARPAALVLVSSPSLPWPGELDAWYRITATPLGRATLVPLASAFVSHSFVRRTIDRVFAPQTTPPGYADHLGIGLTLRRESMAANIMQINTLRPQVEVMQHDYPQLDLPIELVHGDADTIVPLHIHSAPLMALIPQGHLTVLPGVGHMPHHTHPGAVIAAIDRAATRAGLR